LFSPVLAFLHPTLAARVMLIFCGQCGTALIGSIVKSEGPKTVFDLLQRYLVTLKPDQQLTVYYDFACGQ
jgi:hypothetical protein